MAESGDVPVPAAPTMALRCRVDKPGFSLAADLALPLEGITGIYGPSGAGKTTLLRFIAGLESAAGRLAVGNETWHDDDGPTLPVHRRRLGFVFQEPRLFANLDVRGNLEYGRRRSPPGGPAVDRVVDLLGLQSLLGRRPAGLSGGEAQRVAIGRALLRNPRLVLMDEPLASLDRRRREDILPFLERLHHELDVPILYVSHALDEVCRLCDYLVVMESGRLLAHGPLQDVLVRTELALLAGDEAGSVVEARLISHDPDYDLSELGFSGGTLRVPGRYGSPGTPLRVRIRASDVSLCRTPPVDSTILNVIEARIEAIEASGAMRLVRLRAGRDRLLARITHRSLDDLALVEGERVLAQVKSAAIRHAPPVDADGA